MRSRCPGGRAGATRRTWPGRAATASGSARRQDDLAARAAGLQHPDRGRPPVCSVAALAAAAAFAVVLFGADPDTHTLLAGIDPVTGLLLTVSGLVLGAPTCVVAWTEEHV